MSDGRAANDFNRCFDAPSAISSKKWRGHDANDYRGCCSDCGHHVAVAIFFDRAIDRCQAAVARTPHNGGGSFALPIFWQPEFLVSSIRSEGAGSRRREKTEHAPCGSRQEDCWHLKAKAPPRGRRGFLGGMGLRTWGGPQTYVWLGAQRFKRKALLLAGSLR